MVSRARRTGVVHTWLAFFVHASVGPYIAREGLLPFACSGPWRGLYAWFAAEIEDAGRVECIHDR